MFGNAPSRCATIARCKPIEMTEGTTSFTWPLSTVRPLSCERQPFVLQEFLIGFLQKTEVATVGTASIRPWSIGRSFANVTDFSVEALGWKCFQLEQFSTAACAVCGRQTRDNYNAFGRVWRRPQTFCKARDHLTTRPITGLRVPRLWNQSPRFKGLDPHCHRCFSRSQEDLPGLEQIAETCSKPPFVYRTIAKARRTFASEFVVLARFGKIACRC